MNISLTAIADRFMTAVPTNSCGKSKSLPPVAENRSERARRRSVAYTASIRSPITSTPPPSTSPFIFDTIPESSSEPGPGLEVFTDTSPPTSNLPSLPLSRASSPSSSDSSISSDMARNVSGSGWVDMGTLKTGCQLLTPNPSLDALEELWGYVATNLEDREITDDSLKKKEFLRCFAKWSSLKDVLSEISQTLANKTWITLSDTSTNPDDFTCRPFFDTIRDKILGNDWARIYDLKREKYVMLADPTGFSKLVTLMETHNRRLRGTMYHRSNEVLQAMIMQKLPDKFRADLRDCKVSEQLPYAEWKEACKDVEERRPPISFTPTYAPKRDSDRVMTPSAAVNRSVLPGAFSAHSTSRSHRFPKLQLEQKKILYKLEGCYRCYNLFAGHQSGSCPNNGPPNLSVPYRPLNDEDIALANKIHASAPNNSIAYELILKKNVSAPSARPVAVIQDRIALTDWRDFDDVQSMPTSSVQPNDVAAFYGSRDLVHVSTGAGVYGNALNRGFDYNESASAPLAKPVATLIPSRRSVHDYRDDSNVGERSPYSPTQGRNTRRREFSPVGSRGNSDELDSRRFRSDSRSPSSSACNVDHRSDDTPEVEAPEQGRAQSAPLLVASPRDVPGNVCREA
ncbi:hypothetical protein F5890DRAFT_1479081 [Lentinula detonsa]|uniref:Uncharacterized protein n=1 Tax=Lentinula detonsa TaxID=2804962 RepID=A0AA38ULT8_9AGAR|nr:hypothetical protein F5890DRAFT_1479081 [Lentinula detonsa]